MITVSIVNHGHDNLISPLINDLSHFTDVSKIILTNNIPSKKINYPHQVKSKTIIINNKRIKGFSSNHNSAFNMCNSQYFCIINPDVRIPENPFPDMLKLFKNNKIAIVAPAVLNEKGNIEDNARKYPTFIYLLMRKFGINNDTYDYQLGDSTFEPDWLAGMFLLIKSNDFNEIGLLDEKNFFIYCEDIDLCLRLNKMGKKIILDPSSTIIHDAQRTSRRNPIYFFYHLNSMYNFYRKHYFNQ
jgi:N-acetylglucosaminyl-diphospho-decaprenol L-rhamnosyltransferase